MAVVKKTMFKLTRNATKNLIFLVGAALSVPGLISAGMKLHNPSWSEIGVMATGAVICLWAVELDSSPARKLANFLFWIGLPLIVVVLLLAFTQYSKLEKIADPTLKGYAGVAITAVAGLALFAMRYWYRMSYGITEAAVGLYLAWVKWTTTGGPFGDLSKDTAFMTGLLTASIYLVVRGLDNIHTGWKARAKKIEDAKVTPT